MQQWHVWKECKDGIMKQSWSLSQYWPHRNTANRCKLTVIVRRNFSRSLHFLTLPWSLLLLLKYRTRSPTCSLHGLYTSDSLDTALSLKYPDKIPSCRTSPCFVCKSDTLLHMLEWETQVVEAGLYHKKPPEESNVLMQKNKSSASVKRPQIF